ncbi:MAG: hypothetical protein L0228_19050 [Planctomycetes bacterium]|nr:hypothetical protein [Planctomycetota bacterium]
MPATKIAPNHGHALPAIAQTAPKCMPTRRLTGPAQNGKSAKPLSSQVCAGLAGFACLYGIARILRRAGGRLGEVFVGHLKIMLGRDARTVAEPCADDVRREGFFQLGLPRAAKILKQLGPSCQSSFADDP